MGGQGRTGVDRSQPVQRLQLVDFISKIAPIVERAKDREEFVVSGVKRPLSILKQIMQSFVSANGPSFVEANPWIRKFIRSSRNKE